MQTRRKSPTLTTEERAILALRAQGAALWRTRKGTNPETGEVGMMTDEEWFDLKEDEHKAFAPYHATRRTREWKRCFLIGGEHFVVEHLLLVVLRDKVKVSSSHLKAKLVKHRHVQWLSTDLSMVNHTR